MPTQQLLQKKITLPTTNTCAHTSTYSRYGKIFQGLNTIIDDYNNYKIMNDQQKGDRIQQRKHTLNVIIRKYKTKSGLASLLLASCFSPVKSTLLRAIKG